MRIVSIGGGPAGLYSAILLKKLLPQAEIEVVERNRPDDTFGWGVVFSDETLDNFAKADPESFAKIKAAFAYWKNIDTYVGGERVRSSGHGFCGLARKRLLEIFHERCRELKVPLRFQQEVGDEAVYADCDLILAADGINSAIRTKYADVFQPSLDWRRCKFTWLGTDKPLEAFTFIFRESPFGVFQVHAYPFERGERPRSTWIVECREEVWRRAGLDQADEAETVRFLGELFADHLAGYKLLTNRSLWRSFPTVRCQRWHHKNIVLLGDAAHTAHFSIGSGTKLAMEDAIALERALARHGAADIPGALAAYEDERKPDCLRTQRAAQTSLEWFEESARYLRQEPLEFTFNLMTRSRRITYDNLALRDPALVDQVTRRFNQRVGAPERSQARATPPMFAPFQLRGLELKNRIVVSPMCQYMARDGIVGDWHLAHLGALARGGAGLVLAEMTNVSAVGRITLGCAGIWRKDQAQAWQRIVRFVHQQSGARIGLQLGHSGRKGSCSLPWEGDAPLKDQSAWGTVGPSALPFDAHWPAPRALKTEDFAGIVREYVRATEYALAAEFDALELHMAHGYLLSSFLSPLTNQRTDDFGGPLRNRLRFPLEVLVAVRKAWPAERPLGVRLSATDWLDDQGGQTVEESVEIAREICAQGCDWIDVSSAGNSPLSQPIYGRMYQVPFAERIRQEVAVPVMAVGGLQSADHANTVLAAGRADLCALARAHLLDPHLTLRAAAAYGVALEDWPRPYLAVSPRTS